MKLTRRAAKWLLILVALLIVGLVWLMEPRCPAYYPPYPTDTNLISFVEQVSPPPESEISVRCYTQKVLWPRFAFMMGGSIPDGGIAVTVSTRDFATWKTPGPYDEVVRSFDNKVSLYIDSRKLSKEIYWDSLVGQVSSTGSKLPLSADYTFASFPILLPGNHDAKIVIIPGTGDNIEYEWHFKIVWK